MPDKLNKRGRQISLNLNLNPRDLTPPKISLSSILILPLVFDLSHRRRYVAQSINMRCFKNTNDSLDFGGKIMHDADVAALSFEGIRKLSLRMTDITDAALATVADLAALEYLDISQNSIGDEGFLSLGRLHNLRILFIDSTQITDNGLGILKSMTKLSRIDFDFTSVSDRTVESLCSLSNLGELSFFGTEISNESIHALSVLPKLYTLDLGETRIDDNCASALSGLTALRHVGFFNTKLTDATLIELAKLKNLQSIDVKKTSVTTEGVELFKSSLPSCRVKI